ncbi:MAG TPA: hypothetical protein VKT78_10820 [Fimbriimonadaceae bacterium]|nr:hypothetical protein [Fimbriimonadaceae bacterium]
MSRTITPTKNAKPPDSADAASLGPPSDAPKQIRVSPWVKAFVAFHLVAITIWAVPNPPEAYKNGRQQWKLQTGSFQEFTKSLNDGVRVLNQTRLRTSLIKYYDMPTGLWQYWDMFAPNPANIDWYGDAEVIYKDGSRKIYQYPRMFDLGIGQKYFMERFRKFYERAHDDANAYVWPAFAQRVALLSTTDPNNPVVEVHLRRHWLEIMPPDKPQPTDYKSYEYFRYPVDNAKLQRDLRGEE